MPSEGDRPHSLPTTSAGPNRDRSASSHGQPFPLTFTICLPITWTLLTALHPSHRASRLWRALLPDMGSSSRNRSTVSEFSRWSPPTRHLLAGGIRHG